ncbi:PD-(D/E)XK nuclease family protein [bacterium]|nr:PD-(D/E)XK nuclease family protein [bacterium]
MSKTKFDYSRYNTYKKCPLSYKWKYVDFKKPKTPPNMYYALPGIVIQKLFEHFYNDEWFLKRGDCREFMYNKASEIYEKTLKWCNVDWNSRIAKKTKHDVYDEFLEMIGKNLDIVKDYKLLGKVAKSEHTIITNFENNNFVILKSKIDFFIKNQDGLMILDGKATSNKSNYLKNPEQLYFYAMMCKFHYNVYPDKIGFWWWRDAKITFIDFDESHIEKLKEDIKDALYKIYKKKFDATPEYSTCLFCDYQSECTARTKHIAEKQAEKALNISEADILKDFQ